MRETLWDLRHIKERREEMAREMEEVRLARSLRGEEGRLRGPVARLFWEPGSRGPSRGGSPEVQGAAEPGEGTSPTTPA